MLSDEFRDFRQLREARNHARRAERKNVLHANNQYKWADAMRSIGSSVWLTGLFLSSVSCIGHDFFDLLWVARQPLAQKFKTSFGDQHIVFDAHAKIFFGNIDARFD